MLSSSMVLNSLRGLDHLYFCSSILSSFGHCKTGYQNRKWQRHSFFRYQYLKATFCSSNNIWEPHSVPVTRFSRPIFVPVTGFSEGGAPQEFWKHQLNYKKVFGFQLRFDFFLILNHNGQFWGINSTFGWNSFFKKENNFRVFRNIYNMFSKTGSMVEFNWYDMCW